MSKTKLVDDFHTLREHCILLRQNYNTYTALFNEDTRDLLSKVAATFFTDIAGIMHRDWLLQVCKLMDPAETRRKGETLENISIALIDSQLETEGIMSPELSRISAKLSEYGKKIVPARHKRLAHFDRAHQVANTVLGATTTEELEGFLANIQKYCDGVGEAVGIGSADFACTSCQGDVYDLLRALERSQENA